MQALLGLPVPRRGSAVLAGGEFAPLLAELRHDPQRRLRADEFARLLADVQTAAPERAGVGAAFALINGGKGCAVTAADVQRAVEQDGSVRALLGLSDAELAPLLAKLRRAPARAVDVDDFVRLVAADNAASPRRL